MALRSGSDRNKINERDLERIPTSVPRSGDGYGSKEEFDQARAKESIERAEWKLDAEALSRINTRKGLIELLDANRIDVDAASCPMFFDRSWYNRAVVEPVMGFCTKREHQRFLQQVPEFEHMVYEDGVTLIKFWFSISKDEQLRRFEARRSKLSTVDEKAQVLWDASTHYKEEMFSKTHTTFSPWIIVKANDKQAARLESLRYVLNVFPYAGKEDPKARLAPDPNVVMRCHRETAELD